MGLDYLLWRKDQFSVSMTDSHFAEALPADCAHVA
jgi:hypothetical protein